MNKTSCLLFFLFFLLMPLMLTAQNCEHEGGLRWLKEGELIKKGNFHAHDSIIGWFYNPKALDSLPLDLRISDQELSIVLAVEPIEDFPKPAILGLMRGRYSRLRLIPSPYPKADTNYQQLAKIIAASGKKQLTIEYRGAEQPLSGCIQLDLSKGLDQYDLSEDLVAIKKFTAKQNRIRQQIRVLEEENVKQKSMLELEEDRFASAEKARLQLREQHKNLSNEEQAILNELIDLSTKVGENLNKALISNNKAMARKVADLTGDYQKRLNEVKKTPIYSQIQSSFDNYYQQSTIYFTHDRNILTLEQNIAGIEAEILEKESALKQLEIELQALLKSSQ